ncbi:riboflavin kinase [Betta splendens]|uniref:Riboflavin kinase n=1 Tax=Betta splendens TaxID=158456 RepID=A0A8M1HJ05_BETSP|nr:riboflavin kinase [Betta splendens]
MKLTTAAVGKLVMKSLPYFCRGEVIRGFGRGSKELGIPTANFADSVVDKLPADISTGIYYGWACVGNGDIHKMVMSIGWNPYYKNTKKSMETHVIHKFKEDFYGAVLSVVMVGYIRPERTFNSLEALIEAINSDIEEAKVKLDLPEHLRLREDNFFTSAASPSSPTPSSTAASTSQTILNGH